LLSIVSCFDLDMTLTLTFGYLFMSARKLQVW